MTSITLNYWFDTRHTGQGYANEAVRELVRYAFEDLKARRVQLQISVSNTRSLTLAKKLGFAHEGTLPNFLRNFLTDEVMSSELFAMTDLIQLTS